VIGVLVLSDLGTLRSILTRRAPAGAEILGGSAVYRLVIPGAGWTRVEPGTHGDDGSDLELSGPGIETWLVSYVQDSSETDLSGLVRNRRALLADAGEIIDYRESRRFLEDADLVPVALTTAETSFGVFENGTFVILTAEFDEQVVEIVGYTAEPRQHLDALRKLVTSFRQVGSGESL